MNKFILCIYDKTIEYHVYVYNVIMYRVIMFIMYRVDGMVRSSNDLVIANDFL